MWSIIPGIGLVSYSGKLAERGADSDNHTRKSLLSRIDCRAIRDWCDTYSDNISRVFCFYTGKKPVQKIKLFLRYVYTDQKIKTTICQFGSILISSIHDVFNIQSCEN